MRHEGPKLHRFRLLDEGFEQPAVETQRDLIDRRLGPELST
jgi:hypothetical protein